MIAALKDALAVHGMALRGGFIPVASDGVPSLGDGAPTKAVVLVGNIGGAMWPAFAASDARSRHAANPLDQWTRDVVDPIAASFGAAVVYPFAGPPYFPFQRWAARAEPLAVSPLKIFIHPVYGLWHAFRAALLFREELAFAAPSDEASPCTTCQSQPCLHTCPVDAFGPTGLDDGRCAAHVAGPDGIECRERGCLARRACPVGQSFAYGPAQMKFHMEAFLAPRRQNPTVAKP
ncbi:ferredoxin [Dongia sp.]|uniref:ferredoxin n=1 Tax=Dongia sp. TaxID=1977262 RepID=UPI0035B1802B